MRAIPLLLLFFIGVAYAAMATLVSSRVATSVTGQSIYVCTYQYGGQHFTRTIPLTDGPCPFTIEVQ